MGRESIEGKLSRLPGSLEVIHPGVEASWKGWLLNRHYSICDNFKNSQFIHMAKC